MNYYRHYKVRYTDKWSKGVVRETEIHGYYDLQGVKDFFGLVYQTPHLRYNLSQSHLRHSSPSQHH